MFTDGLDNNALQWVRKEEKRAESIHGGAGDAGLGLGRDLGSLSGRARNASINSKWTLPPSQLANSHFHSGLLRTSQPSHATASTSDDWEESVGSISGRFNDESSETDCSGDSQDSSFPASPPRPTSERRSTPYDHCGIHDNDCRKLDSSMPADVHDSFVDLCLSNSRADRRNPAILQPESSEGIDDPQTEYRGGGFYSEYEQQETQSATASVGGALYHQTVGTTSETGGTTEPRDYRYGGSRWMSQTAGDSFPWSAETRNRPPREQHGKTPDNGGRLGSSTPPSSETETSDDDLTEGAFEEENLPDVKKDYYPPISDDFRYPQDMLANHDARGYPSEDQCQLDEANRADKEVSFHPQPDPNLKFQASLLGHNLRRSQSEGVVGLPPSAPPMLASMSVDPATDEDPSMLPNMVSKSTTYSYPKEREHSGSVRPDEPSESFRTEAQNVRPVSGVAVEENVTSNNQRLPKSALSHPAPLHRSSEENVTSNNQRLPKSALSHPAPLHRSGQSAWQAFIAYDACVRLCLGAWARGCPEAPEFLQDECNLLRECFGLQQLLLQPYEQVKRNGVNDESDATAASKPKRSLGKLRVQVRKLRVVQRIFVRNSGNNSQRSIPYVNAGAQYMRQVSGLLKDKVNSLRTNAMEAPQESKCSSEGMSCVLRLKSSTESEAIRMQPGFGESTVFVLESSTDELLIDVQDQKGDSQGRCAIPISSISDDPVDRLCWFPVYVEPEHECMGKIQLSIGYVTSGDSGDSKWGVVGETLAYDIVLEVAMRAQRFQRRNLRLQGSWSWLLSQFASYYGVSEAYTKLRYLASVMEVATPTEDCLVLVFDLLAPIVKTRDEGALNRQEKRILAAVEDKVSQLLALVFENYKSLDETSSSGLSESFPAVGAAAPALVPAVQVYTLLHDILTLDAQITLRNYFKAAAKKRCKRHMAETEELVSSSNDGFLMDPLSVATAYQKMKMLCINISNEVRTDIDIHNQHVLPSSIDLPNVAASIYDTELCNRLRSFLVACPPSSPAPPVAELMLATADFQQNLISWGIRPSKGGVDANDLFHLYIVLWIQDKRLHLLDLCKIDKDRYMWVATQNVTVPFVEEMYERIRATLNEYEVIINRWPDYTIPLEIAIADVERAIIAAIEKQYSDVLTPLKDTMIPKKFSIQYMQKLTRRRSICLYSVPGQLGIMLNSIKRLLDNLRPKVELHMKGWVACLPSEGGQGKPVFGEHLNEVTIEARAKYKNYLIAIVEKLADNTRLQRSTKLKKILQDTREAGGESDIRDRMQPLSNQLIETISHLHEVFASRVFVAVCRGYWDRIARDILHFLENRKENRSWYKGSSIALGILDDIFASQMQRLQGHALQEKDLDPPRSVMEARNMLSKDAPNGVDSSSLFFY